MNVKLKVLTASILAGFVGSAVAAVPFDIPKPPVVPGGEVLTKATKLTLAEKGAYALLEAVQQVAETHIYLYGCAGTAGTYPLSLAVDLNGDGEAQLLSPGSSLDLTVDKGPVDKLLGEEFDVQGGGTIAGKQVQDIDGEAAYDRKGGVMAMETELKMISVNKALDFFEGLVIKDFYFKKVGSRVPYYIDWGLQSLAKRKAFSRDSAEYPQVKYWQRSKAIRSNGVEGHTWFWKDRIYNANGNGSGCAIAIHTKGFNDADGFEQTGEVVIKSGKN